MFNCAIGKETSLAVENFANLDLEGSKRIFEALWTLTWDFLEPLNGNVGLLVSGVY